MATRKAPMKRARRPAAKVVRTLSKAKAKPKAAPPIGKPPAVVAKVKHKLVRDSFTIPKDEYAVLADLKLRAGRLMRPAKKSEILRAGINALRGMADKEFASALAAVPSLKTGRPKQADKAPAAPPRPTKKR